MDWLQQVQEAIEVMDLRHALALFFQQCLQVLFGRLLTMEAELVMKTFAAAYDYGREPVIVFGLAYPLACRPFQTRLCPS